MPRINSLKNDKRGKRNLAYSLSYLTKIRKALKTWKISAKLLLFHNNLAILSPFFLKKISVQDYKKYD